ncbi:hypothetical protein E3N88_23493 [Mikania micrantha]|uniref:Fungal lipase-type domain-containing protein n=1 Tax=Mikania micrantha TaxID=192012 RepID=A0A5N6NDH5_9ASTR|nr:hypothetical protein E3N88_23493 [Mikania micrantha]
MAPEQEIFDVSGPLHLLNSFDWRNIYHRRSIAASLVHGVYILEKDRQRRSFGHEHDTHAPPWWERFHFNLNHVLVDDIDLSYFGAIYELKYAHPYAPKYVIAFRGTIKRFQTLYQDMKLNFKFVYGHPAESPRFHKAFDAVLNTVTMAGAANIWLAGHSLGASIAMLAGRKMAKCQFHLETYLFNPPFNSVPIENLIKNQTLKHVVRVSGSLMKAGIATAMKGRSEDPEEDPFIMLSEWIPYVFVNPSDPICAEYIGYFQHRDKMVDIGMGRVERIAAKDSIVSLGSRAIGRESEPLHLLPTAYLTVNRSLSKGVKKAHKIHQWWQQDFEGSSKLYRF